MKTAMHGPARNNQIRNAASYHIKRLIQQEGDIITWGAITKGFDFEDEQILFCNRAVGIFKPRQLTDGAALSIRSSRPSRSAREAQYEDEVIGEGVFRYKLQGDDPTNHHNSLLVRAMEQRLPLIYFLGLADALYTVIYPTYIEQVSSRNLEAVLSAHEHSGSEQDGLLAEPAKRYGTSQALVRLHQTFFRKNVLAAYEIRCAVSSLAIPRLLNAAHILPDVDPRSRPTIDNGICLSNFHHAAYDANLLGIDQDFRIHVARKVLSTKDGPMLQHGLKEVHGSSIRLPRALHCAPNRDHLRERFREFEARNT